MPHHGTGRECHGKKGKSLGGGVSDGEKTQPNAIKAIRTAFCFMGERPPGAECSRGMIEVDQEQVK